MESSDIRHPAVQRRSTADLPEFGCVQLQLVKDPKRGVCVSSCDFIIDEIDGDDSLQNRSWMNALAQIESPLEGRYVRLANQSSTVSDLLVRRFHITPPMPQSEFAKAMMLTDQSLQMNDPSKLVLSRQMRMELGEALYQLGEYGRRMP